MTSLIALVMTEGVGDFLLISHLPCRRSCLDFTTYAGRVSIDAAGSIAGDTGRRDSPSSTELDGMTPPPLGRKKTGIAGIRAGGNVAVPSSLS